MDITVLETQLKDEYRDVFESAHVYATLKNIENAFSHEKMLELFDLLITAQSEQKPVNKLVGSDVNKFCKDFFSDYTIVERLRFLPVSLYRVSWFVFILELIELFAMDNPLRDFFTIKADMSGYGAGALVAALAYLITDVVLIPVFNRNKKIKPGVWYGIVIVVMIALIAASVSLSGKLTLMLPVWPFLLGSGLYIIAYIVVRAVWRYMNYGTIRNSRKILEKDSYYRNLEDRDLEKILLEGWQKQYGRRLKKGKTTAESYLDDLKKNEALNDKMFRYVTPLIYAALCVFAVIQVASDGSGFWDTIFFAVLISAVAFFIYRWIYKIEAKNAALRKKHIINCEQQGKTMPEYIEETLESF